MRVDKKTLLRLGLALLVAAALVPRARDLAGPFDREFDGFQGSCFAAFCVNYERLGVGRFGGYPSYFVDVPDDDADLDPSVYVYANHPPLVPLLHWATVKALAPAGWNEAWRADRAPDGIEPYLRLPTFVFHALGLLAFWWALREAGGAGVAMLGLALLALTPISIVYAQLVNYENVSLFFVCVGYGFHARRMRGRPGRNLLWCTLALSAACAVTFAPLFFVPPLILHAWRRRGLRDALRAAAVLAPACLAPIAAHALWVRLALPASAAGGLVSRASEMIEPLFSGELPFGEWLRRQGVRLAYFYTLPIVLAAAAGLVVALGRRRPARADAPVELGPPLLLGGALYLLAFYAHTYDGDGTRNGQTMFLLDLAPGMAAAGAALLWALARRLRGAAAPLVVVATLLVLGFFGVARAGELRRLWRAPGPMDVGAVAGAHGPERPLPSTVGAELHELLPAGSVGFYPLALGFNQAPGYYAWRTLIGVNRDTFGALVGLVNRMGLGDRERFLVIPTSPSPAVRAELGAVRDQLAETGPPFAADATWEIWRLAEDG
jgi:hypothetical protein